MISDNVNGTHEPAAMGSTKQIPASVQNLMFTGLAACVLEGQCGIYIEQGYNQRTGVAEAVVMKPTAMIMVLESMVGYVYKGVDC